MKRTRVPIDPTIPVATAVQSAPGVYALLVGSGISKAAAVPTGWDIVADLIGKVAGLSDESPENPFDWYRQHAGSDADYSELLETLAPLPGDRRNLLESYFVPDDDDREAGLKEPTAAHRAIADLVAAGRIRVIVTTNFDRLIETALRDAGIEPVVVANAAAAAGTIPLAHSRCTIIKVHGDFLDPDLKNTVSELDRYEPDIDQLLDQIVDEYGLIICGWSADWDPALRDALLRSKSRRYTTFWTHVGELGDHATRLIEHRGGVTVAIDNADVFFSDIAAKARTLDEMNQSPLSADLAVAELKRYIPDPIMRIRLHDLFANELAELDDLVELPTDGPPLAVDDVIARMSDYEAATDTLAALCATLAFFGVTADHDKLLAAIVVDDLYRLVRQRGGYTALVELQRYPALLGLYAVGLGAVASDRLAPLLLIAGSNVDYDGTQRPFIRVVNTWTVLDHEACNTAVAEPGSRNHTPDSDYMFDRLREPLRPVIGSDEKYAQHFNEFEYLLGLMITRIEGRGPVGRFAWHYDRGLPDRVVLQHRAELVDYFDSDEHLDGVVENYAEVIGRTSFSRM